MLSIYFADDHEWWVPSAVFARLFLSALEHGQLAPSLEEWQYVAAANGGLSFDDDERGVARELMAGLRAAAMVELARLGDVDLRTEDGTYKVSLEKLLAVTDRF
jgi:predicted nucleic acid-binding protein